MDAVKRNLKPVSTTKNKALYIDAKRNATELSKAVWNAKDAETNPSIECSIAAKTSPCHREQIRATSVLPRNSLFYNPTPSQHYSTKDQSFTANAAIKTNSN